MPIQRVKFDLANGIIYQVPINPVSYDDKDDFDVEVRHTLDGSPVRFAPFFDSRPRIMEWQDIPNTSMFNDMVMHLKSGVNVEGTRINHMGLHEAGIVDFWKDIRIDGVDPRITDEVSGKGISKLKLDITLRFSYLRG